MLKGRTSVTREFVFDAAHRLMHHPGKCKNIHGHTYKVLVTVSGDIHPTTGIVMDFKDLKTAVTPIIDEFDHKLILNYDDKEAIYARPGADDVMRLMDGEPTAENTAVYIAGVLKELGFNVIKVQVYETPTSHATWEAV